eukprot:TRINITY_DN7680_c0_g2_i7.p1 TRINITY_DN7680_c0_g2~~TRINITY_DN7680_c0_g2_i7.p1  ORF type:complete len:599 (+),score=251.38 TRINITY_DN7680_c0_g2_i7:1695-3491(+)
MKLWPGLATSWVVTAALALAVATVLPCAASGDAQEVSTAAVVKPGSQQDESSTISPLDSIAVVANLSWWALAKTAGVFQDAYDYGFGEACPYAEDAPAAVRKVLTAKIKGQSLAVDQIVKAFESWQFQRKAGLRQPLVLALTGQTGVGKTETAWQVAEALLTKRQHGVPKGMLRFSGQDFADANNVARYHEQIRRQLADVLVPCAGHAVVLFDELQKVAPGTLDVLVPALENRPMLTLPRGRSFISVDCSNLVVLLVSDIGAAAVRGAILPYARREDVLPSAIMPAVQRALDRQWKHLSFGKVVDWVIPYLPMRRQEVYEVLLLKWHELEAQLLELRMAAALLVTEALTWELTGRAYVAYGQFTYRAPQQSAGGPQGATAGQLQGTPVGESPPRMTHVFSVYGARVESSGAGPIEYLRGLFMRIDVSGRSQDVIHAQLVDLGPERVAELHWCPQGYAAGLSREQLNSHVAVQDCTLAVRAPLQRAPAVPRVLEAPIVQEDFGEAEEGGAAGGYTAPPDGVAQQQQQQQQLPPHRQEQLQQQQQQQQQQSPPLPPQQQQQQTQPQQEEERDYRPQQQQQQQSCASDACEAPAPPPDRPP